MLGNIFVEWHWCTKSRTTSDTKSGLACTGCLQRKKPPYTLLRCISSRPVQCTQCTHSGYM